MTKDTKKSSIGEDSSMPSAMVSSEAFVVTVRDHTRSCSWEVEFPKDTTSGDLIRALVTKLKLPSSQCEREIIYALDAVSGNKSHRFTDSEKVGDYLTQEPDAFFVLLPEVTAG